MKTKFIIFSALLASILDAGTIETQKDLYLSKEKIKVNVSEMSGNANDWVAIYPAGSSNDWGNVKSWSFTDGIDAGTITLDNLPEGEYDARVFFNNSFNLEDSHLFKVEEGEALDVVLESSKEEYLSQETVSVKFENMLGNKHDWLGIYPAGSSNDWGNVVSWKYTDGKISGEITLGKLPVGDYEIRAFFQNTFNLESTSLITVKEEVLPDAVALSLEKNIFAQNELVYVDYANMQGNETDWIGIYPAGASFEFENVIDWKYTKGRINGSVALGGFLGETELSGSTPMPGLLPGDYEIRAFFKNSLAKVQTIPFTVTQQPVTFTMYEDADGGISDNWAHLSGPYPHVHIKDVIRLKAKWINNTTNTSEYMLSFDAPNTTEKILELTVGGAGRWTPHFNVGVLVTTTKGSRRMLWDSFLNHYKVKANKQGNVLSFPTYVELQNATSNNRKQFRVNVDKYLKILEPDNKLISINSFFATGGDLGDIRLSLH